MEKIAREQGDKRMKREENRTLSHVPFKVKNHCTLSISQYLYTFNKTMTRMRFPEID